MKKVYQKPEFEVIKQNQANAKFFVASTRFGVTGTAPTNATEQTPPGAEPYDNAASTYDRDANGFKF